ncbi:MAG: hypothetical protein WC869_06255 [Phycisphaerae bacterium]|jgi:hypothetical protein
MRGAALASAALSLALSILGGCQPTVPAAKFERLNQQWLDTQQKDRDLVRQNQELLDTIGRQNTDLQTLRGLGPRRLEKLFYVTGIEIGRYSGGVALHGSEGDAAVKVYLRPVDAQGSTLKAAGDVKIQIYDLAAPTGENLIGECRFGVDEIGKNWSNAMIGGAQFSFVCPWQSLPAHGEITVRAEFVDYLTGKTFSAQRVVKVRLPATMPTSAPVAEPVPVPAAEPASASAATLATAPATEPAYAPAIESAPVLATEPTAATVAEPAPLPAEEPTSAPAAEPASIPELEPATLPGATSAPADIPSSE